MDHAEQRNPDDNEDDTGMSIHTGPCERNIWYRDDSSSEKCGPASLAVVQNWYNMSQILPSAEFSTDDGVNWISIVELRRRNGPLLPFGNIGDRGNPFVGVAELRERVETERADVARLENEMEELLRLLGENEEQLRNLKELEQILDNSEIAEQLEESPDVAAAPVDSVVTVSQPETAFDPQELVEKPFETVASWFKQKFEKCDWTILNLRTEHCFTTDVRCISCKSGRLSNGSSLIAHFTGKEHKKNRPSATAFDPRGAYTREALAYWFDQLQQCPRYRGFAAKAKKNQGARFNDATNLSMTTDVPETAATPPAVEELTTKSLLTALLKAGLFVFLPCMGSPILIGILYLLCLFVGVCKQWHDKSWLRRSRDKHFGVLDVASDALKIYLESYEARLNILLTFIAVILVARVAYVLHLGHPRFLDAWSLSYGEIAENLVHIIGDFLAGVYSKLIDTGYSLVRQPIIGHVHNAALAYFYYTLWVDERMQKANQLN